MKISRRLFLGGIAALPVAGAAVLLAPILPKPAPKLYAVGHIEPWSDIMRYCKNDVELTTHVAKLSDILNQTNEILDDMAFVEGKTFPMKANSWRKIA